ncbi:MFS transporter [Nocardioides gansuensis]|uniref:MFS transporter n=1 Tax=Nocardioides gansuensis TaxID=2138300 RepID=A0A2T8F8D4_9ACTN|nr:MFS transporter [Nocardioides gansuensis]PVG81969.1 MFS transporter [Nocardioides gansuensis]
MATELQHCPVPPVGSPEHVGVRVRTGVLLVAVLLIAVNLRIGITSLGALLERLEDTGVSAGVSAFLTSLPVLCFAVFGAAGMTLARRVGIHRGVAVALVLLTVGLVARVLGGPMVLVVGTLVACSGIALANILLPAVVKEHYPTRVGQVTGAYSAVLSIGAALGAAATVPVADLAGGWRAGLAVWALLPVVALVLWLPWCRARDRAQRSGSRTRLWRNPIAWSVTAVFGIQSVFAYVVMSWVPSIYADAGFSDAHAGLLLAVSILVGVPVFFVAPPLAARLRAQGHLIAALSSMMALAFLGLWWAPVGGALLWAALLGVGGAVFPVTLTLFALRTRTAADTAAMSAMAQSVGYLFAAAGPFVVGLVSEATGSWAWPCGLLAALAVVQVVVGYVAGRPVVIEG